MDIKSINTPDLSFVPTDEKPWNDTDTYIYACYAKPGHHQILIYDPVNNRAFCKDFMVCLNLREDVFPEYPVVESLKIKKKLRNVFERWRDETVI